jgi:hypothetical protein
MLWQASLLDALRHAGAALTFDVQLLSISFPPARAEAPSLCSPETSKDGPDESARPRQAGG